MNSKKTIQRCVSFLALIMLASFYMFAITAKAVVEIEPLAGDWREGKKSTSVKIPLSASIEGSLLTIQCTSGRSDITICISNDDGIYYEETFLASNAYSIPIYLTNAPKGEYTLELTNQWGDCLIGNFVLY